MYVKNKNMHYAGTQEQFDEDYDGIPSSVWSKPIAELPLSYLVYAAADARCTAYMGSFIIELFGVEAVMDPGNWQHRTHETHQFLPRVLPRYGQCKYSTPEPLWYNKNRPSSNDRWALQKEDPEWAELQTAHNENRLRTHSVTPRDYR